MFTPFPATASPDAADKPEQAPAAPGDAPDDLRDLKEQIAAMQRKIDAMDKG
jgi:polyhydroxyalkanoate synthesis regulator protein